MAGVTMLGNPLASVAQVSAPVIETKTAWSDAWVPQPFARIVDCRTSGTGREMGKLEIASNYGAVRHPHETAAATRAPLDLMNKWVRVVFAGGEGPAIAFVGRVTTESREVHGGSTIEAGKHVFTAHDGLDVLRKIRVSESIWRENVDGSPIEQRVGWSPGFNQRGAHNSVVGNRSAVTMAGTYLFGGADLWTHEQAIQYLLRFVDEGGTTGPEWTLGGLGGVLSNIADVVPMGVADSLDEILRRLIPIDYGLDFKLVPTAAGWEIEVFALLADEVTFGGMTLPRNVNVFEIDATTSTEVQHCLVERTNAQVHDKIRVVGRQAVAVVSLRADGLYGDDTPSLIAKWASASETQYKAGTGNPLDSTEQHDQARKRERLRRVYQHFGAPADWDHKSGMASPTIDNEGQLENVSGAHYQTHTRATLPWLPLFDGYDYSTNPPTNYGDIAGHVPDLVAPMGFIWDYGAPNGGGWVHLEHAGIDIDVTPHDWGAKLNVNPNHLLALTHFDPGGVDEESATDPLYNWSDLVLTVAFETDHRLQLTYEILGGATPSGGDLVLYDSTAELWFMVPDTVIGVDIDGSQIMTPGTGQHIVLRNDADRLALRMAGAIARYWNTRARARVVIKGLYPMTHLLGHILSVVQIAGDTHTIKAPITAISYENRPDGPVTVLRTGGAL